ncbi:DUF6492 family protein [Acidithiobacillus sp. M4-SHS-6]|uniref:DUF6492 family protein n=1 Tax=Acidithiobacillus sp. M4-SHS-6 TaxID=3383024 RepID=UPI0039BDC78B
MERYLSANPWEDVVMSYPANLPVLQRALGIIVHGEYSRRLASQWYGSEAAADWAVIPHLRVTAEPFSREAARRQVGFTPDDLIICSFGFLGPTKLNHRLLESFLASPLAINPKAKLVFVGSNEHGGDYGRHLIQAINSSGCASRIYVTEWADTETFRAYLAAADIAVQLRTLSRGETSGTVLDCMNYGVATIVNAHGSLADLDKDGVWMLRDDFTDEELIDALTTLIDDSQLRKDLGVKAQEIIRTKYHPRNCAQKYMETIERFYEQSQKGLRGVLPGFAKIHLQERDILSLASSLSDNFPPSPRQPQLLLDISELVYHDAKTGIQRVVRAILREWLENPPKGFRVEPVYAAHDSKGYRYARRYICQFLDIPDDWARDSAAKAWPGDVFLGMEVIPDLLSIQQSFLQRWHNRGVHVWFIVYDLLPIRMPEVFPPDSTQGFSRWLQTISNFDGAVCISKNVGEDFQKWLQEQAFYSEKKRPFQVRWFHIGADIENSAPTQGLPPDTDNTLRQITARKSFLMVGTIEPRKGYLQTIEAFNQLWRTGKDINLVIVGKEGWKHLSYEKRRTIPTIMEKLRNHPELGRRLFVLEGISDEYLKQIYAASTCLIAASYGEGFGLPLIEAAQHKLPIIARNIPVFREVAGDYAYYFAAKKSPEVVVQAVKDWLSLYQVGEHPVPEAMPWLTWKESAGNLLSAILEAGTSLVPSSPHSGSEYNKNDSMVAEENGLVVHPEQAAKREDIVLGNPIERRLLEGDFTWSQSIASEHKAAHNRPQENDKLRAGWITTWNVRCGIAAYSEHLLKNMPGNVTVLASHTDDRTANDGENVWRCWSIGDHENLIGLTDTIDQLDLNAIVIQFNYGFFNLEKLRDFILKQINYDRVVVITLHATIDPVHEPHKRLTILVPALKLCHKVLVHSPADVHRLKQLGVNENVEIFPHGVLDYTPPLRNQPSEKTSIFKIASYGFFLPHKGLLEVIDAIAMLRDRGINNIQLEMVNAEFPALESAHVIALAKKKITELNLQKHVTLVTDFLSDKESLDKLSDADLIIFPYQKTAESSSAAVRYGIASGRPVAVTPLPIFDDVEDAVHLLPGFTPEMLTDGILSLIKAITNEDELIRNKSHDAQCWREEHSYSNISLKLYDVVTDRRTLFPTANDINDLVSRIGPCDFCVVNKSYIKDIYWSATLYKSWVQHSQEKVPFFIVVPKNDLSAFYKVFINRFGRDIPIILCEEELLASIDIRVPENFDGWHLQQIVKLGFAKTGWSTRYLTLDSATLIKKDFSWRSVWGDAGRIYLDCRPEIRERAYNILDENNEMTWLRGDLAPSSLTYREIDDLLGLSRDITATYTTSMIFDSKIVVYLENYLRNKNINGIIGAIQIAPYEYRWYGTYVMESCREDVFYNVPFKAVHNCHKDDKFHLDALKNNEIGFVFQPPACTLVDPKKLLDEF